MGEMEQYLEPHRQRCSLRRQTGVAHFDYFRGDALEKRETHLITERGEAILARTPSKFGQPRYRIDNNG